MSVNKEYLVRLYLDENKSTPEISTITNLPISRIRKLLIDNGIKLRTRTDGIRNAANKIGNSNRGKHKVFSDETKKKMSISRINWSKHNAKGIKLSMRGYYEYTTGINKGKRVHDILFENHIGRKLEKNEVVHHINEIKTDNRIENLKLMTRSEHSKLHIAGRVFKRNEKGRFICQ